jgi:site-specific DNA-methyltransferase (adenine-specific)
MSAALPWEVLHGDCLEILPTMADKSADHVITDPPYLLNFRNCVTWGRRDRETRKRPMGYEAASLSLVVGASAHLARIPSRWCLVFSDVEGTFLWRKRLVRGGARYVRTGVWVRTNPCPQFTGDRPGTGFEAVTICHAQTKLRWNGGGHAAIWSHAQLHGTTSDDGNYHPTPKPIDLMLELVEQFSDPGDLVLDPFCGSGTTGVACLRLGRRFIGIEKDAGFARIATERLEAESQGLTLRAARAGQMPLFAKATP